MLSPAWSRLLLLGPPGAGKSTIAALLLAETGGEYVGLDDDVDWAIRDLSIVDYPPLPDLVIDYATARFLRRISVGGRLIAECPHYDYPELERRGLSRGFDLAVVVYAPLDTLVGRNISRAIPIPTPFIERSLSTTLEMVDCEGPIPRLAYDTSFVEASLIVDEVLAWNR